MTASQQENLGMISYFHLSFKGQTLSFRQYPKSSWKGKRFSVKGDFLTVSIDRTLKLFLGENNAKIV